MRALRGRALPGRALPGRYRGRPSQREGDDAAVYTSVRNSPSLTFAAVASTDRRMEGR